MLESDINKIAKDLIQKGNDLGDMELIAMGTAMLKKYSEPELINEPNISTERYVCTNCHHIMSVDKVGRKKCPVCKKHTLTIETPKVSSSRVSTNNFQTQIRKHDESRARYSDDGQPDGMYARTEAVSNIVNMWTDDGLERNDPENERLKAVTKISTRTRKPPRMVDVTCDICKKTEQMHPIHVSSRTRYVCTKCLRKGVRT